MKNTNKMNLIRKWMRNYMYHESSPLFDMEIPKPHPIISMATLKEDH
jgi:hypothetical protein